MADKKKVEKKVDEKSEVKSVKKSSYSKKKKVKKNIVNGIAYVQSTFNNCLLYTSPSPRDERLSRMPSSA